MRSIRYILSRALRKILNPPAINHSQLGNTSRCDIGSVMTESILGEYSYISEFTHLLFTEVGKYTAISNYCAIGGTSHPVDWVSTSPVFNNSHGMMKSKLVRIPYEPFTKTTIGNDVWLGPHCLIKGDIIIGDSAVIGMGSVVTKNVGPYEIWAGNPARLIRKRFPEETINLLLKNEWWNWSNAQIREKANMFCDANKFVRTME